MSEHEIYLENEAATLEFGKRLAAATFDLSKPPSIDQSDRGTSSSQPGHPSIGGVIHLLGDLGAGKTTLTRGLMRAYGYEGAVKSPTYTLVEPYEFETCNIYHFDLYRLSDPEEALYLGTDDYFQARNLCIVEWAERGSGAIPPADLLIQLGGEGTGRSLRCLSKTDKGELIAKRLWP